MLWRTGDKWRAYIYVVDKRGSGGEDADFVEKRGSFESMHVYRKRGGGHWRACPCRGEEVIIGEHSYVVEKRGSV